MRFGRYLLQGTLALSALVLLGVASRPIVNAQTWTATPAASDASQMWTPTPAAASDSSQMWTPTPASAAVDAAPPALKLDWATEFNSDAALYSPGDVAIDSKGNAYVSTQGGNSVVKFDKDGKFVKRWGASGDGKGSFNLSLGVAIDSWDNVYITDFYNHVIQKFDSDGNFLMQWDNEKSTSPAFIGIDGKGNVYVDEFPPHDNHYIQKFDPNGKLLSEWDFKSGDFGGRIEDIAVDQAGNVFVADPFKNSIKKLDTDGKLVASFGGDASKKGNGEFFAPNGIAVDGKGFIYALDGTFLQKLAPDGEFVAQWSTVGGDLDKASNVTVDSDGNIYVFAQITIVNGLGNKVGVFVLKKFSQSDSGW